MLFWVLSHIKLIKRGPCKEQKWYNILASYTNLIAYGANQNNYRCLPRASCAAFIEYIVLELVGKENYGKASNNFR